MGKSALVTLYSFEEAALKQIKLDANHSEIIQMDTRPYINGLYTLMVQSDGLKVVSKKVMISDTY